MIRSTTSPARLTSATANWSAMSIFCVPRHVAVVEPEAPPSRRLRRPLMPLVPLVVTPSISPTAVSSPFASDVMLIPSASWLAKLANVIPRVASLA